MIFANRGFLGFDKLTLSGTARASFLPERRCGHIHVRAAAIDPAFLRICHRCPASTTSVRATHLSNIVVRLGDPVTRRTSMFPCIAPMCGRLRRVGFTDLLWCLCGRSSRRTPSGLCRSHHGCPPCTARLCTSDFRKLLAFGILPGRTLAMRCRSNPARVLGLWRDATSRHRGRPPSFRHHTRARPHAGDRSQERPIRGDLRDVL